MKVKKFVIRTKYGIHLRPAARIFEIVREHRSKVQIKKDEAVVDARSALGILALNIIYGDEIEVIVDGPDENIVMDKFIDLIEVKNFYEDQDE